MKINKTVIGPKHKPYVIGELSGNHNGDIDKAIRLIEACKEAGVDAVKLQTYTADTLTIDHDSEDFKIGSGLWEGETLYSLYQKAYTPWEWHEKLFQVAHELGLDIFSTPFDNTATDFLEKLDVPAYKIASFEMADHSLLRYVASKRKPIILSTGMASLEEIRESVQVIEESGCNDLAILHCVSGYPSPLEDMNLRTISDLSQEFKHPIGLSDHSMGTIAAVCSVALGACIIEKHVTLDRNDGGPDAEFSLEPGELKTLCKSVNDAFLALGKVDYGRKASEKPNLIFRKSLYAVKDISEGEVFDESNIRSIRPGYGLPPKLYSEVIGSRAKLDISRGQPLKVEYYK